MKKFVFFAAFLAMVAYSCQKDTLTASDYQLNGSYSTEERGKGHHGHHAGDSLHLDSLGGHHHCDSLHTDSTGHFPHDSMHVHHDSLHIHNDSLHIHNDSTGHGGGHHGGGHHGGGSGGGGHHGHGG